MQLKKADMSILCLRKYAIKRDWYRFYSAYMAGKYYRSSKSKQEKMDQKFSQQLRQINQ